MSKILVIRIGNKTQNYNKKTDISVQANRARNVVTDIVFATQRVPYNRR